MLPITLHQLLTKYGSQSIGNANYILIMSIFNKLHYYLENLQTHKHS